MSASLFPTLASPSLVRSQLGIVTAQPFQAAPILGRCPNIAILDKFMGLAMPGQRFRMGAVWNGRVAASDGGA